MKLAEFVTSIVDQGYTRDQVQAMLKSRKDSLKVINEHMLTGNIHTPEMAEAQTMLSLLLCCADGSIECLMPDVSDDNTWQFKTKAEWSNENF